LHITKGCSSPTQSDGGSIVKKERMMMEERERWTWSIVSNILEKRMRWEMGLEMILIVEDAA